MVAGLGGWQSAFHPFFAMVFRKKSSGWWNPFSLMKDRFFEMSVNFSKTFDDHNHPSAPPFYGSSLSLVFASLKTWHLSRQG